MIVKFLRNRGNGTAKATMDYLLGKNKDREGVRLLTGAPELTQRLSDSLNFRNRYTVGVLSFEEHNLPDEQKRAIMESFESSLLAGLDRDQYNITWVEHTDKDRLELNFVIVNQELTTGKRLQPYYDKVDRPLVENWKQVTNHKYGLTDPHDPAKAQAVRTLNRQNLPKNVRQVKEQIGQAIAHQVEQGNIADRKGVTDALKQAGFEIARETDKSISIKNPEGKRNIRLEGVIYENRQLGTELGEEHRRAKQTYTETSEERYQTALGKLQRSIKVKQERNRASFSREHQTYQREQRDHTASLNAEDLDRGINGELVDTNASVNSPQRMVRHQSERQKGRIGTDRAEYRTITATGESTSKSRDTGTKWNDLYSDDRGRGSKELQQQDQSRIGNQIRLEHERLFDTMQRTSGRTGREAEQARNTDKAIESSQSSVERTEQAIIGTDREITSREQQTQQRKQQALNFIEIASRTSYENGRSIDR